MKKACLIAGILAGVLLLSIIIVGIAFFLMFDGGAFFLPNPPKPEIKYSEFNFTLEYEIDGEKRTLSDTYICEFDGYRVDEGQGKTRRWKGHFKNEQQNELYAYRIEDPDYTGYNHEKPNYNMVVLQNIDHYKIVFSIAPPEYFLNDPDYKFTPQMPYIQVYDVNIGYFKDEVQSKEFLDEYKFKILNWYCDQPIKNNFY